MRILLGALALLFSLSSFAAQTPPLPLEQCKIQAPYGFPTTNKKTVSTICRAGYFTIHDNKAKIPVVTAYVLKPEHAVGCEARDNSFAVDRSLPSSGRSGNKDYAKSGHDIGHMANAADLKWSSAAQDSAALLSNAAPQLPEFNRGIWKKLEDTTRGWTLSRQHDVLIYVGPVYNPKTDKTIGKGFVGVPHAFFKILVDVQSSEVQVFLMKHEGSQAEFQTFITSLAEVQKQTGIVFPMPKEAKFTSTWPIEIKSVGRLKSCALK